MAGNHLMQELAIMTGALEAMVVDYQCIMPAVTEVAKCFHTQVISTSDKAKFPGAIHVSFDPNRGIEIGKGIVRRGVEAFANRNPERVRIPVDSMPMMAGFSVEAILAALGGTPAPLVDAIKQGTIRGAVGVVGCNNPKIPQDYGHVVLTRRLIENDILVVVTGCAAVANGKAGQMVPEAAEQAGPGLKAVCKALGIPPVLHMGSCVDNSRIITLAAALANYLGVDIDQLPLAGAAPEWYSEKAVSIGAYVVASGIIHRAWSAAADFRQPQRRQTARRRIGRRSRREVRRRAGPREGGRAHSPPYRVQTQGARPATHRTRVDPCARRGAPRWLARELEG